MFQISLLLHKYVSGLQDVITLEVGTHFRDERRHHYGETIPVEQSRWQIFLTYRTTLHVLDGSIRTKRLEQIFCMNQPLHIFSCESSILQNDGLNLFAQ